MMSASFSYVLFFVSLCLLQLASAQIGETCKKIQDGIKPQASQCKSDYKKNVCGSGKCKPVPSDWVWAKKNGYKKIMDKVQKDEGLSGGDRKKVDALINDVANDIMKDCKKPLGKSHLCQENKDVDNFSNCIKDNAMPIVMSRMFDVMPLASEPNCQKHMKVAKDPKTWKLALDIIIAYSKVCNKK